MSDDPSWLHDDSPVKGAVSPHAGGIPRAPPIPKPATPSRKQIIAKNKNLEEEGLDFLMTPVGESSPQVVKETKSGVMIVDEDLAPCPTVDKKGQAIGAPVHFLKRMREAEEKRLARLEKLATAEKEEKAGAGKEAGALKRPPTGSSSVYKRLGSASIGRIGSSAALNSSNGGLNSTLSGTMSGGAGAPKPLGSDGGIVETDTVDLSVVPELSEDDKADYSASIAAFGEEAIRKLRSNRYQHRVEAIRTIKEDIIAKKHLQEDEALMGKRKPKKKDEADAKETKAKGEAADKDEDEEDVDETVDEFGIEKDLTAEEKAAAERRKAEKDAKSPVSIKSDDGSELKLTISNVEEDHRADTALLVPMVEVLSVVLKDSLFHVVVAACDLLDGVLENYTFLDKDFVDNHLKTSVSALITRLKDSNSRTKDAAVATLLNLSAHSSVGPSVVIKLVAKSVPIPAGADSTEAIPTPSARDDWRYMVAKLDLCHSILDAKPRYISSLSDDCLRIATHGLASANPQARKRAAAFFGLVRGECGAEGIKRYLSTISAATIKMLKQEIGIDDPGLNSTMTGGSGGSAAMGVTLTAAKLAGLVGDSALGGDNAAEKEEQEDMAAFEGDGDKEAIGDEHAVLIDFLAEQFPEVKSFALLFSSRWNLRERLILRLVSLLEHKAVDKAVGGPAAARAASADGQGILAKMAGITTNNNNTSTTSTSANAGDDSGDGSEERSPLVSPKQHAISAAAQRFLKKDSDDESDEDEGNKAGSKKPPTSAASGKKPPLKRGTSATGSIASANGSAGGGGALTAAVVTPAQLGAVVGIVEKSSTDSVPAVAAAAVKLLRIALAGYQPDAHKYVTHPSTPIDGSARSITTPADGIGRPPRAGSAGLLRAFGSQTFAGNANANAATPAAAAAPATDDVPAALHMLVPRLVNLTSGALTSEGAHRALAAIASLPFMTLNNVLKDIIAMERVDLVAKASVKAICARLDSCSNLLATVTTDRNVDIFKVVQFATAAFQHREPKARTSAATLVIEMYKRVGDRIHPHLEHVKGAVGDDLRAKMAKITRREREQQAGGGGSSRVRLAVFGSDAAVLKSSSTPAPPQCPSPQRGNYRGSGGPAAPKGGEEIVIDMAQGKNRKGNLVLS